MESFVSELFNRIANKGRILNTDSREDNREEASFLRTSFAGRSTLIYLRCSRDEAQRAVLK